MPLYVARDKRCRRSVCHSTGLSNETVVVSDRKPVAETYHCGCLQWQPSSNQWLEIKARSLGVSLRPGECKKV